MSESEPVPLPPLRLPLWVRLCLFGAGWFLVLLGIAGLFLPVLQGWLTIFLGVAVLSMVSEIAYEVLRKVLARWPKAWKRIERFREKAHGWLQRFHRE